MNGINRIVENKAVNSWLKHFLRYPEQINRPHESDAELLRIPVSDSHLLTVTIDTISEEISTRLYRNPFTIGWVTVMASFSDLAAVGAEPVGFVASISLEPSWDERFREEIAKGMTAACQELGVYLLGGDTNSAAHGSLTGCSLGFVPRHQIMMRSGCRPGDHVFLSGRVGQGNALGLTRMAGLPEEYFPEKLYRPKARLKEGQLIRKYATCCMDTSDGLLITLDQLSRINDHGFSVEANWEKILAPEVWRFCQSAHAPPWFMAAGIHGEFELVCTVPPNEVCSFLEEARSADFHPVRVGVVEHEPWLGVVLNPGGKIKIDMAPLRNLWSDNEAPLSHLIQEHHAWGRKWGLE